MNPRIAHLRIKIINLADEAKTIRREEKRALRRAAWKRSKGEKTENGVCFEYDELHAHRKGLVGPLARVNLLAYAFLRDVPYAVAEADAKAEPKWAEIKKTALRFDDDPSTFETRWTEWQRAAMAHFLAKQAERAERAKKREVAA